jgi:hypothetical protein
MGCHHAIITPSPSDWDFLSITWMQLIRNWFVGSVEDSLPPPLCKSR